MNVEQLPKRDRFSAPNAADTLRRAIAEKCPQAVRPFVMASTFLLSQRGERDEITLSVPTHSAEWQPEYADAIYAAGRAVGQSLNFNFLMRSEPNSFRLRQMREQRYGT